MAVESIYGDSLELLESKMQYLVDEIQKAREQIKETIGMDPVEHLIYRIKSEESMREKCVRKGLPQTPDSALRVLKDAIGVRVVCAFVSDVYSIRDYLVNLPDCELVEEKDYIRNPKENGYRSYHMILMVSGSVYAEIQLRTISMDTWAALEHHMHYKKEKTAEETLITAELKRCADELASTDLSMQTIRDMIRG
ncbi:MAG: GTP pyrophosphokinase family protein [Eubacterium sp.]|nr:GTP pyrophosphokinase family protein [Eubacterium sp.]